MTKRIADYQMFVHVFGSTSTPSYRNDFLRRKASDNENTYEMEVSNIFLRNVYVDDLQNMVK